MRLRTMFVSLAVAVGYFVWPNTTFADTNKTLGSFDTAGSAQDVVVVGSYAYVADGSTGVIIIDTTNPAAPSYAGSYDTPGTAKRLDVVGSYLYVADDTSLQILNLTTPTAPTLAGTYTQLGLTVNDVATDGVYAYLLGPVSGTTTLTVVDIQNPASIAYKSALTVTAGNDVVLSSNYAYLVGGTRLDVVNAYPILTLAGGYTDPDNTATYQSVQLFGSGAYINDSTLGFHALNISNPAAPTATFNSSSLFPGTGYGSGIVISNGFAFVAINAGGLAIYDVASASTPNYLDTYSGSANGMGVTVANDVAYLANGGAGIQLLDVSHPDTVPPVATPVGGGTGQVPVGGTYTDPGVTVTGGTVTKITGTVDTSRVGKYILTYTVTDRVGNTTLVDRVVYVAPVLERVRLVNNTLTIKVKGKNVVLRPFPGYRGALLARKAIVNRKTDPLYFFVGVDAMSNPALVVYNASGRLVSRQLLRTISTRGLQFELAANPVSSSIYLALAPKTNVLKVWIYNISRGGIKLLKGFTTAGGRGTLLMKFLKTYDQEYGLVTMIRNSTKKPYVWRYGGSRRSWYRDVAYDLSKLIWTKTSVRLK